MDTTILPGFEQKPVVSAFISPSDTMLRFFVSSNKKIYGNLDTITPLRNLRAFLSDGSSEKELDTCNGGLCLSSNIMHVIPGGKYRLRITAENNIAAAAECTVPKKNDFSLKADTVFKLINYGNGIYIKKRHIRITFKDIPGEPNFFRLSGQSISYIRNINTGLKSPYLERLNFEKEFFTDQGSDGREIQLDAPYNSYGDSVIFRIFLFNTEQSYYLYHKSIKDYNYSTENPFSEATPIFSNIEGGLGIFSSYTTDTLRVKF